MDRAVAKLLIVKASLLSSLACKLCYTTERLTLTLTLLDLLQHDGSILGVNMEIVIQLLTKEVIEELLNTSPIRLHIL